MNMQCVAIQVGAVFGAVALIADREVKMAVTWKYKIDISDIGVFGTIAHERNISFPKELKEFILETNAATPSKYNFMVGNNERVFGAVLSFNPEEKDVDSVFTALSIIKDKDLIPFGIDPFGNYICYSLKENIIVFWDHETGQVFSTGFSLAGFIESLY